MCFPSHYMILHAVSYINQPISEAKCPIRPRCFHRRHQTRVAASGSGAPTTAEITHAASAPGLRDTGDIVLFDAPMATSGRDAALLTLLRVSKPQAWSSL